MSIDKEIIRETVKQTIKEQIQDPQINESKSVSVEAIQLSESEFNELYESVDNKGFKKAFKALYEAEDEEEKVERAADLVEKAAFRIFEGPLGKKWIFVTDGRRAEGVMYNNNEFVSKEEFSSVDEANAFIDNILEKGFIEVQQEKKLVRVMKTISKAGSGALMVYGIWGIFATSLLTILAFSMASIPSITGLGLLAATVGNTVITGTAWFTFKGIKKQIPKDFKKKTTIRD